MAIGRSARSKRTCLDCSVGRTAVSGEVHPAQHSFALSTQSTTAPSEIDTKLQEELAELQRERKEREEQHLRDTLANVWLSTQLVLAAVAIVFLRWSYAAVMIWVLFLYVLHRFPKS